MMNGKNNLSNVFPAKTAAYILYMGSAYFHTVNKPQPLALVKHLKLSQAD